MVDGIAFRFMNAAASGAGGGRRRKLRAVTSIAQHLEIFRTTEASDALRDTLADLAMRLVDAEDRNEFERFDGPTSVVDYLSRITEEQATCDFLWDASTIFQSAWVEYEVRESLLFTLVTLCHGAIEESISREFVELGAARLLWEVYATLPAKMADEYQPALFSAIRNLSFARPREAGAFLLELINESWRLALGAAEEQELRVVAAETLTNLASHDPALVDPTQQRIAALVLQFLALDNAASLRIAHIDLLCNLACDPALCLLAIYELDERKPRRFHRHSGAVYLLELTEAQRDAALRQSMEALAHNLSWSDPTGKRKLQKLGLSSFMARFAREPAINN